MSGGSQSAADDLYAIDYYPDQSEATSMDIIHNLHAQGVEEEEIARIQTIVEDEAMTLIADLHAPTYSVAVDGNTSPAATTDGGGADHAVANSTTADVHDQTRRAGQTSQREGI